MPLATAQSMHTSLSFAKRSPKSIEQRHINAATTVSGDKPGASSYSRIRYA